MYMYTCSILLMYIILCTVVYMYILHVHVYILIYIILCTVVYILHVHHVPSMLAIGVDKHTQQTNKQPQWLH